MADRITGGCVLRLHQLWLDRRPHRTPSRLHLLHDRGDAAGPALRLLRADTDDAADPRPAARLFRARLLLSLRRHARRALPDTHPRRRPGLLLQRRPPGLGRGAASHRHSLADLQLRAGHHLRRALFRARRNPGVAAARNKRSGTVIDLSADLGEGAPDEPEIWPLITSANVACGGHYGDADSMAHAADRARELGTYLGAHPSYPDRANFGRKSMSMTPDALRGTLIEQIT